MIFGKRVLTDQLDDFVELSFFVENLLELSTQVREVRIEIIEVWIELSKKKKRKIIVKINGNVSNYCELLPFIVRSRDIPVYWREMLTLSEFLIETPENLHNRKGSNGNGICEITTWRWNCTNDGNGTFSVGRAIAFHTSCSFVEESELISKISRITLFGRHLSETTRDFSECFCPSGGWVSHHGHIITHISEVLC